MSQQRFCISFGEEKQRQDDDNGDQPKNNLHTNQTTRDSIRTINYKKHLIRGSTEIGARFDVNMPL